MENQIKIYDNSFEIVLQKRVNFVLRNVGLVSALLGFSSASVLTLSVLFGQLQSIEVPIIWTIVGGVYSLFLYSISKKNLAKGFILYGLMGGLVSLPTVIYLLAFFYLPSGTATYLSGPPSYLYFFLIACTGLTFNFRLSFSAGIFAAIQYQCIVFLSAEQLASINHPDLLLTQDLTNVTFYSFRSLMMGFTGFLIGILAKQVHGLISETLEKERKNESLNRIFGQYVSPEVREKVLKEEQIETKGERKKVAILFSDIRGFTSVSESKSPEEIVFELNEYFDEMEKAISFEFGTVDKFIGDAVMAVFGGVIALENPSLSAFNSSIAMIKRLETLNTKRESRNLPKIRIGIGLHYGEVYMGSIGSKSRKDFTVIGDTVNTTSRLESLCKEFKVKIIFSDSFKEQLPHDLQSKADFLGKTKLKGKENPVGLYSFAI